jgi:hypothetical protein
MTTWAADGSKSLTTPILVLPKAIPCQSNQTCPSGIPKTKWVDATNSCGLIVEQISITLLVLDHGIQKALMPKNTS